MDRVEGHMLAAGIIWFSAVIGFLCSYKLSGNPRILSLGNTFGGGVLLAAGLVHLANDSFNDFTDVPKNSWAAVDYPWAGMFVSIGFLTTLFMEEAVLYILTQSGNRHSNYKVQRQTVDEFRRPLLPVSSKRKRCISSLHEAMIVEATGPSKYNTLDSTSIRSLKYPNGTIQSTEEDFSNRSISGSHDHENNHGAGDIISRGFAVAIVFLCAISCHSFISGLGVGAMQGSEIWSGILAVVAHKSLASFTLSTCFINGGASTCTWIFYMSIFSLVTPLGIMVGSFLTTGAGATEGALIGLAAGSFIYIGVLEVISRELEEERDKKCKLLLLILGWGLMSLLAIWV
jgi:zinc transporter ZupT